ncbi:MAG TPA: CvpA family protein [Rhodocyclaceae bacterium]|nr:CvpA family protein [Rhodocyclaceae bacterium]
MTTFDYVVIAVLCLSVFLGVWRGVMNEILALLAWVAAFFAARAEAPQVAVWLTGHIGDPGMRMAAAYVIIVIGVLLVFALARMLIAMLLKAVGLSFLDRMLGAGFGVLRGLLVIMAGVLVAGMTPLPQAEWWRDATLSPPLETAAMALKPWLPADVAKRVRFR